MKLQIGTAKQSSQVVQGPIRHCPSRVFSSSLWREVEEYIVKAGSTDPEDPPFHSVQIANHVQRKVAIWVGQGLLSR